MPNPTAHAMEPQAPIPPNMTPRWLLWIVASVVLPALPWVFGRRTNADSDFLFIVTGAALTVQLITSIALATGVARQRNYGVLGISRFALAVIGFTLVFTLASLAIGVCVWLAGCAAALTLKS